LREIVEKTKDLGTLGQLPEREFTNHPWMGQHVTVLEKRGKFRVADA
jgi:hypothetical protein